MTVFEIALRLLLEHEASEKYSNLSLNSHILDGLEERERAELTALFYTVIEGKLRYDYIMSALAERSIDKIDPRVRGILRLGLCAIADMAKIPEYAAVNECAKLGKNKGERAFINGVLREAIRRGDDLPLPPKSKNPERYYSVRYSLPIKTVRYFVKLLGEDEAVRFFETTSHGRTDLCVSVNTLKISVDGFVKMLADSGYVVTRGRFSPTSVYVENAKNPRSMPGFSEGLFFVQDEASAIAAIALGAKPGDTCIDVCSAPGGKSFLLSILCADNRINEGTKVYSFDIHESKLSLIVSGKERLSLNSLIAKVMDAREPDSELFGKADKVLCDVPCSGLGVMRKKADIRYKDLDAARELLPLQREILNASSKYLKVGGELVYSTCTLNEDENIGICSSFLSDNPDFCPVDFEIGELKSCSGALTLYPHIHNTDGFFIFKMKKNS